MKQYLTLPKTGTTCAMLVAVSTLGLAAESGGAGAPSESLYLTGVVRDVRRSHPDFNTSVVGGFGHYAGNVSFHLGPDRKPVFSGNGSRVDSEWRDIASRPIAPHLFGGWGAGAVLVAGTPSISALATEDTWDSSVGPYGGANVGPPPNIVAGATMPTISPPGGRGSSTLPATIGPRASRA